MTKQSAISSALTISLLALGMTFKLQHWPGANVLFVSGILTLVTWMLPIISFKANKSFLEGLSTFLPFSAFATGIAFKFLHLYGAGILLLLGTLLILTFFVPIFIRNNFKNA